MPERRTPLIGREDELNRIADLLAMAECRLVTLTGLGGVGKTTLAIQAARELAGQYAGGACFVPFPSSTATELVVPTIRQALGITFGGDTNAEAHLMNWLRQREVLLVLDNMEQVPDGGRIVANILQHASNVRLLVTSRKRLNVPDEWIIEVEGLEIPEVDTGADGEFEHAPACQLFMQIVHRLAPRVQLRTADRPFAFSICRMVEGLPLAIELAAAWAPVLTLQDIAEELTRSPVILESTLGDLPARHQNMRAVFDQSWSMLPEQEQAVFRRLSVFRGGFSRAAAELVADASLPILSMLVHTSFLRQDSAGRYSIHGLLRQYGEQLLLEDAADERRTQERHGLYYLGFLRQRETALMGRRQKQALREISPEIANIRMAWRWAIARKRIEELSEAMQALWLFCVERGWMEEGRIMFGLVVDALDDSPRGPESEAAPPVHELVLAKALVRQGGYRCGLGRYAEGMALLERGIRVLRSLDAAQELALALNFIGAAIHMTGTIASEREVLEESLTLFRRCNSAWGMAYSLNDLGMVFHLLGDDDMASRLCQESLGLFRSLRERRGLAFVLSNLGIMAADRGDRQEAESLIRESLSLRRASEDGWGIAVSLTQLGIALRAAGSYTESGASFREALQTASDGLLLPAMLDVLMEWATLRVAEGLVDQALDIVTVILDHPAAHARIQDCGLSLHAQILEREHTGSDRAPGITFDELTRMLLTA